MAMCSSAISPDRSAAPQRRGAPTVAPRRLAATVLVIVAATGCGSGDAGPASTAVTPPANSTVPTVPTGPATTPAATSTPGGTPPTTASASVPVPTTEPVPGAELTAADVDAISAVFILFFGGQASTIDEKVKVLENGELYRGMLEGAAADERFQQLTTEIRDVRAGSASGCAALGASEGCAIVVHDLLVSGFPMAAAVESPAVRAPGGWLVGWQAWCNVVEIGGAACPTAGTTSGTTP